MVKSSSSSENESCCSKSCKKNTESLNSKIADLTDKLSDSKNMLFHYKAGLSQFEAGLVEFKNQEIKYYEKIRVLEFKVESRANCIKSLTKELEELKKEKEGLDTKLTGFLTASKDLDCLIESQKSDKNKEDDTITDYTRPSHSVESNPNGLQNNSSYVSKIGESTGSILSKLAVKFVKAADCTEVKTNKVEAARKSSVRYAEMYRRKSKSPNVRENQRNWNNLKSQQLGNNFVMKNKACFNCGDFDHLSYDCGLWVKKGRACPKNNYTHKSMPPRAVVYKTVRPPMRTTRPNMNVVQPKRTSVYKPAHSYLSRPVQRKSAVITQSQVSRVDVDDTLEERNEEEDEPIDNYQVSSNFTSLDGIEMATVDNWTMTYPKSKNDFTRELGKDCFKDKEEVIRAIKLHTIKTHKHFEVVETSTTTWRILPLAFGIAENESYASWFWFLFNVKKHVVKESERICLISDRHAGILKVVNEQGSPWLEPCGFHRYCFQHFINNFNDKFRSAQLKALAYRAGSQNQVPKFNSIMEEIGRLNPRARQWLAGHSLSKWTLAHDGGNRYGFLTTNLSEIFNSVLKGARFLPITTCVQLTFYRLVHYFNVRRPLGSGAQANGYPYTPHV
nr:hypothetical protein [Tanacetum cinerariifolium]